MHYKTRLSSHNSSITASASVSASLCTDCQNFHLPKGSYIQQQRRGNCAQMSCSLAEQIAQVVLSLLKWWGWRAEGKWEKSYGLMSSRRDVHWVFPHLATFTVCQYFVAMPRQGRAAQWLRDRTGWESALIQASAILMSTWDTCNNSCHLSVPGMETGNNGNNAICLLVQRLFRSRGGKSCVTMGESRSLKTKRFCALGNASATPNDFCQIPVYLFLKRL